MRFLPLLSSRLDASPWNSFQAVELTWAGGLHPGWEGRVRAGLEIHALHLSPKPWDETLVAEALEALRWPLGADFLVVPAECPEGRAAQARFLGTLETLLEALQGRGVKIALRPAPGHAPPLVALLKELRCDAVGYCWDAGVGAGLEALADRLFCAVGEASGDFSALQRLGYRWNLAIPAADPEAVARQITAVEAAHPMVFFPEVTA
jgi:hypothetical protein